MLKGSEYKNAARFARCNKFQKVFDYAELNSENNEDMTKMQIKFMTYNIWFEDQNFDDRAIALL